MCFEGNPERTGIYWILCKGHNMTAHTFILNQAMLAYCNKECAVRMLSLLSFLGAGGYQITE